MTAPTRVCAACGAPVRVPFRVPPAEQAPDLDGRPGEPTRSTLAHWIATCRRCRASAPDLADLPHGAGEIVKSESYQALQGPFLRWAALCEAAGRQAEAAEAVLQGAWALDDAGEDAAALRLRAVALWGEPQGTEDALRIVDIQRRAGAFDAALAAAAHLDGADLDENSAAILAFQRGRIVAGDQGRHGIGSALRPPARRPHVTHGRQTGAGGWWQRLFGA